MNASNWTGSVLVSNPMVKNGFNSRSEEKGCLGRDVIAIRIGENPRNLIRAELLVTNGCRRVKEINLGWVDTLEDFIDQLPLDLKIVSSVIAGLRITGHEVTKFLLCRWGKFCGQQWPISEHEYRRDR